MTLPADPTPDDKNPSANGTALAARPGGAGVDPFVPKGADASAPRSLGARMLDYSAHAAMIVGLVGFAWTVGDHVVHRPGASADAPAKIAAARPAAIDPLADLQSHNRQLAESVRSLQARLDALQASLGDQGKVTAQVRVLQAGLDAVKTNLGTARSEQATALAKLDGKIDKIGHEPGSRMQQLVDRLGKLERSSVDVAPTASLPHSDTKIAAKAAEPKLADAGPMARPIARPVELKADSKTIDKNAEGKPAGADETAKPQVIANWVVRDVYQGVALIEGRRGTLEVVPGVSIPGAGVVRSIDRHGGGWTVTTTKGVVVYAAAPREYRRADRGGFYPGNGYRYDF